MRRNTHVFSQISASAEESVSGPALRAASHQTTFAAGDIAQNVFSEVSALAEGIPQASALAEGFFGGGTLDGKHIDDDIAPLALRAVEARIKEVWEMAGSRKVGVNWPAG
jgi:hypothetical protein